MGDGMTDEQKKLFVEMARAGVTQGFHHVLEWPDAYQRMLGVALPYGEAHSPTQDAWDALAAFWSETGPWEATLTRDDMYKLVDNHFTRCCFPGCYGQGHHKVKGRENTNLKLCAEHEGCVKAPPPPPDPSLPPPGIR